MALSSGEIGPDRPSTLGALHSRPRPDVTQQLGAMNPRKLASSLAVCTMLSGVGLGTIPVTPVSASTQDGTTAAVTDESPSAQITRLYEAFFLRTPPAADREFWVSELNGGRSLDSIAEFFATSEEFNNRYGSDLSAEDFVELVYQNVLGRSADTDFWADEIEAGNRTRGTVMVGFSESEEFRDRLLANVDDSSIFRLYCAYFGREPDAGGRDFWKGEFANGRAITEIADAFAGAPEYTTLYGDSTDAAFVDTVYLNVLNRPRGADETFWLDQLESGAFSRGRVMIGFSEAPEYANRFATNPPTSCPEVTGEEETPDAPVATDDEATTGTGVAVTIDVLVNDVAEEASVLSTSEASNGTVVADGNSITYTPTTGFTGTDTFTYIVGNDGGTDTGTVTINVVAGAATANPDEVDGTYNPAEGGDYTPDVFTELLSNDTPNGNDITAIGFTNGDGEFVEGRTLRGGTVSVNAANEVTYTAPGDFRGTNTDNAQDKRDSFSYTLGTGDTSSTTTVSVTVEPRELAEVNCGIFLNPPVTGDETADPVIDGRENYILFLRSGGCFQPYEYMPGGSGTLTLEYSDLTLTQNGGDPIARTAVMAGEIAFSVDVSDLLADTDPDTDGVQSILNADDEVVLTGMLTIKDGDRVLATNEFTGTWFVSASGSWIGQSGSQVPTLLVDPFTGDDIL